MTDVEPTSASVQPVEQPTSGSSPYGPAETPTGERTRKPWDVALSIVFLVLGTVVALIGGIFALVGLAFIDYCPEGCSVDNAVSAQFAAVVAVVIIGVVGLIATIVLLVTKRRAWWVALLDLVLIILALVLGWVGMVAAVSY